MNVPRLVCLFSVMLLPFPLVAPAQESGPSVAPASGELRLDVVVDTKSGQPVPNLRQQDFTVLDNKTPRPITYFKIMSAADDPVSVIILVDAVNIPFQTVAWSRQEVEKYLKTNEGKLPYPTSVAVLTDQGVQIDNGFSIDGNALSDGLEHHEIGLREVTRDSEWVTLSACRFPSKHSSSSWGTLLLFQAAKLFSGFRQAGPLSRALTSTWTPSKSGRSSMKSSAFQHSSDRSISPSTTSTPSE